MGSMVLDFLNNFLSFVLDKYSFSRDFKVNKKSETGTKKSPSAITRISKTPPISVKIENIE